MRYYNEYEIQSAEIQFSDDPILGPAVRVLTNLKDWTNRNSDGWAYWVKPLRAASRLIELIDSVRPSWGHAHYVTEADVKKAYVPIKSFLTRQGVNHSEVF